MVRPNGHFNVPSKSHWTGWYWSKKSQNLTLFFGHFSISMCTIKGSMGTAPSRTYMMGYLQCTGCSIRCTWCSIQRKICSIQCKRWIHTIRFKVTLFICLEMSNNTKYTCFYWFHSEFTGRSWRTTRCTRWPTQCIRCPVRCIKHFRCHVDLIFDKKKIFKKILLVVYTFDNYYNYDVHTIKGTRLIFPSKSKKKHQSDWSACWDHYLIKDNSCYI